MYVCATRQPKLKVLVHTLNVKRDDANRGKAIWRPEYGEDDGYVSLVADARARSHRMCIQVFCQLHLKSRLCWNSAGPPYTTASNFAKE